MTAEELFFMIDKACDRAMRAVRPGDQSFVAFTVFRTQLQYLKDEHHARPEPLDTDLADSSGG